MASLPTPTVVRIKRRLGAESSESIIVSSKRKRFSDEDIANPIPDICTAILKKLTTLKNGDSFEIETEKALEGEGKHSCVLKEHYKKGFNSSAKELIRKKTKSDVAAIRFKLICSKRNLDENKSEDEPKGQGINFHMLDALKENEDNIPLSVASSSKSTDMIACNGVPMESEKVEYVYDLYYTSLPIELSPWIDNICEIQRYNALEYTDARSKESSDPDDDDDDENSESNWRNDYPDEEGGDFFEDDDDYLCKELEKAKLNESDESYDVDDYDDSGDFDEDGNLLLYDQPRSVFGRSKKEKSSSGSDDDD